MIRLAGKRGIRAQTIFINGSATALGCEAASFDRVIRLNVFPHFTDRVAILREFARLLRPEGQLRINHFEGRESLNNFHLHAAPEVSDHKPPCPYAMRRLMEETGFELLDLVDRVDAYWVKAAMAKSSN
jgi:ubiquinone/menaquinone biosynthesis C-methylase UbiE